MSDAQWFWWAGSESDVEAEGVYSLGEFATREEVVSAAVKERLGEEDRDFEGDDILFYIIEAQMGDWPDTMDHHPFAASRNKTLMRIVGNQAEAV